MLLCVKPCCWSLWCHKLSRFQGLKENRWQAALSSLAPLHYDVPPDIVVFLPLRPSLTLTALFFCPSLHMTYQWKLGNLYFIEHARGRWCRSGRGNVRSTLEEFPSLHPCPSSGVATKSPIQMLMSNLTPINPVTPAVAAGFKPTVAESLPQIHMYVF